MFGVLQFIRKPSCPQSAPLHHPAVRARDVVRRRIDLDVAAPVDPPPLKWSDLRYVSDIQEDYNGKEALQA